MKNLDYCLFPSPYGVSFILIANAEVISIWTTEFPSPYGVSFILIELVNLSIN